MLNIKRDKSCKTKQIWNIDGDMNIPVWIINGESEGKTLIISAGVHGCEYSGILASRKLYNDIDESLLKGRIIILPLLNEEGFYHGLKQLMPQDGKNLNRVFPGDGAGSCSQRLAAAIESDIYPLADFILDMHGGDINEAMEPLVFYPARVKSEVSEAAREAASCLPVAYRLASSADNGLYSYAAIKGIPGLLLEIGSGGVCTEEELKLAEESIYSLLGALHMYGEKKHNDKQAESRRNSYIEAQENGFWYQSLKPGMRVKKGQILGELKDIDDNIIQTVIAEYDANIYYYARGLGVSKGFNLVAYGREEEE